MKSYVSATSEGDARGQMACGIIGTLDEMTRAARSYNRAFGPEIPRRVFEVEHEPITILSVVEVPGEVY